MSQGPPPLTPLPPPLPPGEPPAPAPVPKKKTMLYLGLGTGCLLLLLLAGSIAAIGGYQYMKQRNLTTARTRSLQPTPPIAPAGRTTPAPAPSPSAAAPEPLRAELFLNSSANLPGPLAEHYFDALFLYPAAWTTEGKGRAAGHSFTEVRNRPAGGDTSVENFTLGQWTHSVKQTDEQTMAALAQSISDSLAKSMSDFHQLSLGTGRAGRYEAVELKFSGRNASGRTLWGRFLFLPRQNEQQNEAPILFLVASDLAPEIRSADDVGVKGELPMLLNSFRWGDHHTPAVARMNELSSRGAILFYLLDFTGDGKLSGAELLPAALARFDRDHDGSVSEAEFVAANSGAP